jgi:hypothetical protein
MEPPVPDLDIEIPEITQIAFVVDDIDDVMDRFGGILGLGPWDVYRFEPPTLTETTYRGEPHDYSRSSRPRGCPSSRAASTARCRTGTSTQKSS